MYLINLICFTVEYNYLISLVKLFPLFICLTTLFTDMCIHLI